MKRTVKVRAWNTSKGHMVQQYSSFDKKGTLSTALTYPEDSYELMQYTGLHDRNGQEIYEGDIVTKSYGVAEKLVTGDKKLESNYRVEYFLDGYVVNCVGVGWSKCMSEYLISNSRIGMDIIGNIYENPELLTKNK